MSQLLRFRTKHTSILLVILAFILIFIAITERNTIGLLDKHEHIINVTVDITNTDLNIIKSKHSETNQTITVYNDIMTGSECILDYHTKCRMKYAQNILFTTDKSAEIKDVRNLTYFVVGHHGGVQIDILSFLYHKLHVPTTNIISHCEGSYCPDKIRTFDRSRIYWNRNWSRAMTHGIIKSHNKHRTGFWNCCYLNSGPKLYNISKTRIFAHDLQMWLRKYYPEYNQEFDIIICSFPGVQCLGYLRFAKVIVLRFAHRYDHHVWNKNAARIKWTQILHIISSDCFDSNIILSVSNIYDWFYFKHAIPIDDHRLHLWPNFAQHFVKQYAMNNTELTESEQSTNDIVYLYVKHISQNKCEANRLNASKLQSELRDDAGIQLIIERKVYKSYLYHIETLHTITGLIVLPYSVHAAKWSEFYSVGIAMFFPSLRLWKELNKECDTIHDRQAGNMGQRIRSKWIPVNKRSECCGTNPFTNDDQHIWLPFSDYYNDKLFKYIMYYDNETHLKGYIVEHSEYSVEYRRNIKMKQIKEWHEWSETFAANIGNVLSRAFQQSLQKETNCIPEVINRTEDVIEMRSRDMKQIYLDSIAS